MSRHGQAHDDAVRQRSLSDLRDGRRGRLPAALRDGATLGEPGYPEDDPQAGRAANRRLRTADRAVSYVRAMKAAEQGPQRRLELRVLEVKPPLSESPGHDAG